MAEIGTWQDEQGVSVVRFPALESLGGVQAFFTGRRGGVSAAWQGGLNWSYSVGDDPEQVAENRRRTLSLLGPGLSCGVMAGLVHGDRVVTVTGAEEAGRDMVRFVDECDALVTDRPGVALIVTAADCVPVLLYDPARRAVGAVHAGWRGTVAGIAGKAVRHMAEQYGCDPADIHAVVGPSIGPCCYEVDDAVAVPLRAQFGVGAEAMLRPGRAPGKYMLDLWAANRADLERAGVGRASVSGLCTSCEVQELFSHRAEGGKAGRGAAIIALI